MQGFFGIFVTPFLVPMTIDADPSRRAAVQSGAAQLLGGAFGPLVASRVVDDAHSRGVLYLGVALALYAAVPRSSAAWPTGLPEGATVLGLAIAMLLLARWSMAAPLVVALVRGRLVSERDVRHLLRANQPAVPGGLTLEDAT